jgi:hypothetical protein
MREVDVAIGRTFSAIDGLDDDALLDVVELASHDDEDDAFERWLATVPTSNFEHILNDMLDVESSALSRFDRTA